MRSFAAAAVAALGVSFAAAQDEEGTGRDLLWSNPTADLPDVLLSKSVEYVTEGSTFFYTVVLTHQPGLREDLTADLGNDEVRIYLTSSQEVYQQTGPAATEFSQMLGHRTQLTINTNYVSACTVPSGTSLKWSDSSCMLGTCHATVFGVTYTTSDVTTIEAIATNAASECTGNTPAGNWVPAETHYKDALPYRYVPYSTVNPTQPSPDDGANYETLCPLCTHTKYCTQDGAVITGDASVEGTGVFDGCLDLALTGYTAVLEPNAGIGHAAAADKYVTQKLEIATHTSLATAIDGSTANPDLNLLVIDYAAVLTPGAGNLVAGFDGVTGIIVPKDMGPIVAAATDFAGTVTTMPRALAGTVDLKLIAAGSTAAVSALSNAAQADVIGNSDYRSEPDGYPVERDIPDPSAYCRYCNRPTLKCSANLKDGTLVFVAGDMCNMVTVNGGDQQPGALGTWTSYKTMPAPSPPARSNPLAFSASDVGRLRAGSPTPTWRGDVSSAAQLVFDSRNWNQPQSVKVTAFDDGVYEPNVNGRGQDAYVHHFVVAQDENLQHTYYDDIDVNDLVVSITDNDHAVVVQTLNTNGQLTPEEGYDYHSTQSSGCADGDGTNEYNACSSWSTRGADALIIKLSSEPMYDVVIYVQSGPFFDGVPAAATILPDDEQVIFQDMAQVETCFTKVFADSASLYNPTCATTALTTASACDPHGSFIAPESFMDQTSGSVADLPTQAFGFALGSYPNGLDLGDVCSDLTTETICNTYNSAGCVWSSTVCVHEVPTTAAALLGAAGGTPPTIRKSMDLVCQSQTATEAACNGFEGCAWDPLGTPGCRAQDKGFDCNSYVVFTSTNWAVAQTLKVIAVDDDEDEAVTLGATELAAALARSAVAGAAGVPSGSKGPWGMEDSAVGYLIASKDWYYNSDGARFMASTRTGYVPKYNSPIGFEEAGTTLSSVLAPGLVQAASVVSTARGGSGLATVFTGLSAISGVTLSMFDTRFGTHINRYPYTTNDADVPSGGTFAAAGAANGHNGLTCGTSSPMFNCAINVDSNTADANQEVCTDSTGTWTEQVNSFDPTRYTADGATCGATVHTQDNDNKGVVVSRSSCEATEGRRTYYQKDWDDTNTNLAGHMKDPTILETRFGLFLPAASWPGASTPVYGTNPTVSSIAQCPPTPAAKAAGTAHADLGAGDYTNCGSVPIDYWTASNTLLPPAPAPSPATSLVGGLMTTMHGLAAPLYMTMPTCPLTVQLSSSPAEGKSVVITMQEDPALAALRDHELYFYEEPTFRFLSSALGTLTTACEGAPADASCAVSCDRTYPGSTWLAWADAGTAPAAAYVGACFINNVPIDTTSTAELFKPNGGTSIKLTFTSNDWSVGRRITIIALNDDVDEPPEARTAYFTMDTALTNDDKYDDAVFTNAEVLVNVFDDDIADVVLLCGDNKDSTIGVHATDYYAEDSDEAIGFIGSYDDALGGENYIAGGPITGLGDNLIAAAGPLFGVDWQADDTDPATGAVTTPGRIGYNAEDGLAHGYEHSFGGGGRPGNTIWGADLTPLVIGSGTPPALVFGGATQAVATSASVFNVVGAAGGSLTTSNYGYISAMEADATGADATVATGCLAGLGFATVAEGAAQLQRCYPNTWADYDSYDPYSDNYFLGTTGLPLHDGSTATGMWNHVRGFKGVGPAASTGANNYECTIHAKECENVVAGFCYTASTYALDASITDKTTCEGTSDKAWSYYRVGGGSATATQACEGVHVGSFEVRLNSSPGQKTVRRQYVGETSYTDEKELVYVVVTPDETPQTKFEPASLTFTDTGGYVNGVATQRWDKPAVFNVRPVDDDVDERRGFIVDFTAMTVTTSHLGDTYHTYTTPYQIGADTGEMHVFGDSATGRTDGHTLYRHTIRTVHTLDNDWSGVTVGGQSGGATVARDDPSLAGKVFTIGVTEGGSFNYYTLQLDSQPAKIQRQAGTDPNTDLAFQATCGDVAIIAHTPVEYADGYQYFADNTYIARHTASSAAACGTVEPPADYWVDVTVTQSIHVDLAVPPTCPTTAPWGGGSTPPTAPHPRFPFNADAASYPYDEVNGRFTAMTKYLTTCGGWQRDATYRFDATNWDTPQYVYVYAHNDKDGLASATPSGSETSTYAATLKHYVETEDTTDNILVGGDFVQRNKHGGIYTWGNSERYPFGNTYGGSVETDPEVTGAFTGLYDTGFTTRGFTSYESLYGYYAAVTADAGLTTSTVYGGYPNLASACCNTNMPVLDATTTDIDVTWAALSTRTGGVIHASCTWFTALGGTGGVSYVGADGSTLGSTAGAACIDTTVLDAGKARPYSATGKACIPANLDDGTA